MVALLVGPGIFRRHVRDALGYVPPDVGRHLDMAFHTATLISLGVAVAASVADRAGAELSRLSSRRAARRARSPRRAADRPRQADRESAGSGNGRARPARRSVQRDGRLTGARRADPPPAPGRCRPRAPQPRWRRVESYVEALADGVLAADEENWSAIRSETARLNRLVDDLQRVSRAEAHQLDLHPEPVPPGELVRNAVKAASPAYAAKDVALESDIEPNLPTVEVDPRADRARCSRTSSPTPFGTHPPGVPSRRQPAGNRVHAPPRTPASRPRGGPRPHHPTPAPAHLRDSARQRRRQPAGPDGAPRTQQR